MSSSNPIPFNAFFPRFNELTPNETLMEMQALMEAYKAKKESP